MYVVSSGRPAVQRRFRRCHVGCARLQVVALVLEPLGSGTWLCVDGELVPFERIYAECHPGLCNVICAA